MVYNLFNQDLVSFYGLLECSTHRGTAKIGAMSRMPKNYTPALPAEVLRLYHTGAICEKKETIADFLLHCTKYAFKRWALIQQVKKRRKELTIETLLGEPELAIPLANYMDGTGRFRTKIGEHEQTPNGNTTRENHGR